MGLTRVYTLGSAVQAEEHVRQLREQVDSPAHKALGTRQRPMRKRVAAQEKPDKQKRLEEAIAQLPELKRRQAEAA